MYVVIRFQRASRSLVVTNGLFGIPEEVVCDDAVGMQWATSFDIR